MKILSVFLFAMIPSLVLAGVSESNISAFFGGLLSSINAISAYIDGLFIGGHSDATKLVYDGGLASILTSLFALWTKIVVLFGSPIAFPAFFVWLSSQRIKRQVEKCGFDLDDLIRERNRINGGVQDINILGINVGRIKWIYVINMFFSVVIGLAVAMVVINTYLLHIGAR